MEELSNGETNAVSRIPSIAAGAPVGFSIFRLARAQRALVAQMLRELGLYPGQEILLMHLLDHDAPEQTELIRRVGIDASTATKMLQRLECRGLLVRRRSPHDGRAMTVHLTAKGKGLKEPLSVMWEEIERRCAASLSESQKRSLINMSERIASSIGADE